MNVWNTSLYRKHLSLEWVTNSLKQPANPEKKDSIKFTIDMLKVALLDRSKKGHAPEPIQPRHQFKSAAETVDSFLTERNKHIAYIETTKDDLHDHITPHPFFGMLDGYQWLFLLAGHTKRHTLQIEEVMESPGFPKS